MGGEQFDWPWQYGFPPFFTLQPNLETRQKQLEAWCSLILSYCKQKKIFTFDVTEAQTCELFNNKSINRKLSQDDSMFVLETLRKHGNLYWADKKKTHFTIIWRTPQQVSNFDNFSCSVRIFHFLSEFFMFCENFSCSSRIFYVQ